MTTARCLQIADLVNEALRRELGQGIDSLRMVAEPLYARDVLLVCDALPGGEPARLAQQFREAAAAAQAARAAPAAGGIASRRTSRFGRSQPGAPSTQSPHVQDSVSGAPHPLRRWFSPSRWRGDR